MAGREQATAKRAKPFYKTKAWQMAREAALARDGFLCQSCLRDGRLTGANTVHHIKPLELFPALALTLENLESICVTCHNKAHPDRFGCVEIKKEPQRKARVIVCRSNPEAPPSQENFY